MPNQEKIGRSITGGRKEDAGKESGLSYFLPGKAKENSIARRYREMIAEALFTLMETDDYGKISITQICQEAQIARQTFYHHFHTKDEVVQWYLYVHFLQFMEENPDTKSMEGNIKLLFQSGILPKEKLALLKKQELIGLLVECMSAFLNYSRQYFQYSPLLGKQEYTEYQDTFIAMTLVSVLVTWGSRGFQETPDELTEITIAMLRGINP